MLLHINRIDYQRFISIRKTYKQISNIFYTIVLTFSFIIFFLFIY